MKGLVDEMQLSHQFLKRITQLNVCILITNGQGGGEVGKRTLAFPSWFQPCRVPSSSFTSPQLMSSYLFNCSYSLHSIAVTCFFFHFLKKKSYLFFLLASIQTVEFVMVSVLTLTTVNYVLDVIWLQYSDEQQQ